MLPRYPTIGTPLWDLVSSGFAPPFTLLCRLCIWDTLRLHGSSPSHGYEVAINAKEQLTMKSRDRGLIVIHRGDRWFGRMRRYRVSIDNRPSGYVARIGPTEFSVDPGVHTVEVAMDWGHSLPLRLEVAPGSRTDLRVARRPWSLLKASAPAIIFIIVANLIASLLRHTSTLSEMG